MLGLLITNYVVLTVIVITKRITNGGRYTEFEVVKPFLI